MTDNLRARIAAALKAADEDWITYTDLRDRIAQVIYGDGNKLSWARCVELADLVMWEIRR